MARSSISLMGRVIDKAADDENFPLRRLPSSNTLSEADPETGIHKYPLYYLQSTGLLDTSPDIQRDYGTKKLPVIESIAPGFVGYGQYDPNDPRDNPSNITTTTTAPVQTAEMNIGGLGGLLVPAAGYVLENTEIGKSLASGAKEAFSPITEAFSPAASSVVSAPAASVAANSITSVTSPVASSAPGSIVSFDPTGDLVSIGTTSPGGTSLVSAGETAGNIVSAGAEEAAGGFSLFGGEGSPSFLGPAVGFVGSLLSGEKPVKAAVKAGLSYAGTAIGTAIGGPIGGFIGGAIGGLVGGRVICNELARQGLMDRRQIILDYKFTQEHLTPQHVNGYHVWAVHVVKKLRKGKGVKFWKHIASHRANEIAYIYGERANPDYLGKIYRRIGEPTCWLIGAFCKKTDWSVLYNPKEI
jgi:hypothetical protein